jgi:hypothetical protein
VTNTGDNGGVNPAPSAGTGTLRQAIIDANATPGADTIDFALPDGLQGPAGWWTIQPGSALPDVTADSVIIDGWSQAGAGPGLAPKVMLDGSIAGPANGLHLARSNSTIRGLAIGNFTPGGGSAGAGITMDGMGNAVQGCYVGLDPSGTTTAPNNHGIDDVPSVTLAGNTIGGANPGEGNVISGNGLDVYSRGYGVTIRGNIIGLNAAGTAAVDPVYSATLRIGFTPSDAYTSVIANNVIAGSAESGISANAVNHLRITGNLIGTDITGTHPIPNGKDGIEVGSSGSTTDVFIGGIDPGSRNVIAASGWRGINIGYAAAAVRVQGNYVGTPASGVTTLGFGNGRDGIVISSSDGCLIGGSDPGAGNLIADNAGCGISISSQPYSASDELIRGNVIRDNGSSGVAISQRFATNPAPVGDTISENSIYGNAGLGIDLLSGDSDPGGVTLNDSLGHAGANHFQDFPDLASVTRTVGGTTITGTLTQAVTPNTQFRIEFFANTEDGYLGPDGFRYGQGERYLGSVDVTTDANGCAPIAAPGLAALLPGERFITATATNLTTGDTSEFSRALAVPTKQDQTIAPNWPARPLGVSSVTLNLTSSSGLPVSYAISGPATFNATTNILTITGLGPVTVTASQDGDANYNPATPISTTYAVAPASVCGVLFKDFNGDGFQDLGELGVGGVSVTLTGTDFNANPVSLPATTGASGYYQFPDLLPGTYTVSVPGSVTVTKITVGLNGSAPVVVSSAAGLAIAEGTVENVVNFGVQPAAGDALHHGQTAGIGFWNNKNGQALIRSLDGGSGTQLGGWLAATLPHLFGSAGHDLTQSSNADVAAYFQLLFATRGDKLEAQVLATALSVYVTNSTLAGGGYATAYGFTVVADGGTGLATVNVSSDGAAVDQANGTTMTILDILLAVDRHATQSTTTAGFTLYAGDQATRGFADDLLGRINDLGGI